MGLGSGSVPGLAGVSALGREKNTRIRLPDVERGRSPADIRRFDKAVKDLAKCAADPHSTIAQLDNKLKAVAKIEGELEERRELAWQERARAETMALEALRGGEATVSKAGVIRFTSRDGLAALYSREDSPLSQDDYEIGLRYRAGYERRHSDLAAAGIDDSGRTGHDNDRFTWSRLSRAQKTMLVARIDRAIALDSRAHPEALAMIRWVAGLGNSLRSKGAGRAYERNLDALKHALRIALKVAKAYDEEERKKRGDNDNHMTRKDYIPLHRC